MNRLRSIFTAILVTVSWLPLAFAQVKLPAVIGENMVLQHDRAVPIWGWAKPGEKITVRLAGQTRTANAGEDGRWKVVFDKLSPGGPLELEVQGSSGNKVLLKNILVGEVWVCSGQSNMEMSVLEARNSEAEIKAADYPQIRLFTVTTNKAPEPQADCTGRWVECRPQTVSNFSAVAYYFGRELFKGLKVPVGLIHTSLSGTPAELWTSRRALAAEPALRSLARQQGSSQLYNGMIAPLIPFAIRGAIWYQGEANRSRAYQYRSLFPALINNWRTDWGRGDFPFGFVQLAPYRYVKENPLRWAELREAQVMTLQKVPHTGMVVTMDIGDVKDIHAGNKQEVGRRMVLWALAQVYGRKLVYSGPIYKSMAVEGNHIRLEFDHVGGGLVSRDGKPLTDFTIAGEDQDFMSATARIDGDTVIVSSPDVSQPVAVRYAWRDDAEPNLANKEGLPASPFRTDTWKGVTEK
jgi:sialate O-acetylesterase